MTTKAQMIEAIESMPTLGRDGLTVSPIKHRRFLESLTEYDVRTFTAFCEWLRRSRRRRTMNSTLNSNFLTSLLTGTHELEGAFLAAVIRTGIRHQVGVKNVYLPLSNAQKSFELPGWSWQEETRKPISASWLADQREVLISTINQHPTLGEGGFGKTTEQHAAFLASITDRETEIFISDCEFVERCRRTPKVDPNQTSLFWSHIATDPIESHGLFLAAALSRGVQFKLCREVPRAAHLDLDSSYIPLSEPLK